MPGARSPALVPVDNVAVVFPPGGGLDARRLGSGLVLGDAERLQPELAGSYPRQVLTFLFFGTVPEQRTHSVHLRVAGSPVGAGAVDLLQDYRGFDHPQSQPAVLLRDQGTKPSRLGQCPNEFLRIALISIELSPVLVRVLLTNLPHVATYLLLLFGQTEFHEPAPLPPPITPPLAKYISRSR